MADDVQHAATLQTRRLLFVDEVDRHLDLDLHVLRDAQEVDMDGAVGHRMLLQLARQDAMRLAVDGDFIQVGEETRAAQLALQFLRIEIDHQRRLIITIDHSRYIAVTTGSAGGPLTGPFAQRRVDLQHVCHIENSLRMAKGQRPSQPLRPASKGAGTAPRRRKTVGRPGYIPIWLNMARTNQPCPLALTPRPSPQRERGRA